MLGALAQAAPDRVIAAGNGSCATPSFSGAKPNDGRLWVYLETIGGGSGARATKDGLDGVHVHMTNTSNLPVEALEIEEALPRLPTGKLYKRLLRDRYWGERASRIV